MIYLSDLCTLCLQYTGGRYAQQALFDLEVVRQRETRLDHPVPRFNLQSALVISHRPFGEATAAVAVSPGIT